MREVAELEEQVVAAAEIDMDTVAETLLRRVLGDATWEGLPEAAKEILTANGHAIVAELRGGYPDITAEQLGTIDQPTLLVGGKDSLLDYTGVMTLTAPAMPSARVEWVEGGHVINPAHPVVLGFVDEVVAPGGRRRAMRLPSISPAPVERLASTPTKTACSISGTRVA